MTPIIPLDLFARTRALLDRGVSIDEALGSAGLDWPTWLSIEETWLTALANDAERGKVESLEAFSRAYASEVKALGGAMDLPVAAPPPAFASPAEAAMAPHPVPLETTSFSASSSPSHALPAPPLASPWAAQAAPVSKKHPGLQTAPLDLTAIVAAAKALPFKKPTTAEITAVDVPDAGQEPALPFREAPPEGIELPPKPRAAVSDNDEERMTQLNLGAVDTEDTLPFIPTHANDRQPTAFSGPTGTEPTLVALRDPPRPAPSLPLETYAALAAVLLREGHAVASVFRRFNTTAEDFRAAETYYEPRIKADPEMARRFSDAYFLASMPKSR